MKKAHHRRVDTMIWMLKERKRERECICVYLFMIDLYYRLCVMRTFDMSEIC